jgi:hypothetical protein
MHFACESHEDVEISVSLCTIEKRLCKIFFGELEYVGTGYICTGKSVWSEAEFMNIQFCNFVEASGHNIESSQLLYSVFTITNKFQPTFAQGGGGVKSVGRSDCE